MTQTAETWVQGFLSKRGLSAPTGAPLYSYRMTHAEFAELERIFNERLGAYLAKYTLGQVAEGAVFFGPLFVLYASEWWRRRYDGSGWTWAPILSSLGAGNGGWTQLQRSDCVTRGLSFWRLGLRESRGLRFLGTIAFQGGLPLQLIASARGNIGSVLSRVLKLAAGGSFEAVEVQRWVESLQSYLPQSYRQPQIYVLLAEVILAVLRLKEAAQLSSSAGAVEKLDRLRPDWRSELPLPIEDAQAQGLLDQLIRDAASVRVHDSARPIEVLRNLEEVASGDWRLHSDVDLPEYLDVRSLTSMFGIDEVQLARSMHIELRRGKAVSRVGLRKLAGQDKYRLERRPMLASDEDASSEHTLTLTSPTGEEWHCALRRGHALHAEMAWVFDASVMGVDGYRFHRQGGGGVTAHQVLVLVPNDWKAQAEAGHECVRAGHALKLCRSVMLVEGVANFSDPSGVTCRVRCGQAGDDDLDLMWVGERDWSGFVSPQMAFRGLPRLYAQSSDGLSKPAAGHVAWRIVPEAFVGTPGPEFVGPVDAIWPTPRAPAWKSRLVLLPKGASIEFEGGQSPTAGQIRFADWNLAGCRVVGEEVGATVLREDGTLRLSVIWRGAGSPPEWLTLELSWPGNPSTALLRMPFPGVGVRAFDGEGRSLQDQASLVITRLHGVRMVASLGQSHQALLEFDLESAGGRSSGVSFTLKRPVHGSRIEVRLADYTSQIQRLLAGVDTLDARVRVSLRVGSAPAFRVHVSRYACSLVQDMTSGEVVIDGRVLDSFSAEMIGATRVRGIRLDLPEDEPIELAGRDSEGVPVGAWKFAPDLRDAGAWLIFPGKHSSLQFRPTIWPIGEQELDGDELRCAVRIASMEERAAALDACIERMAGDFLSPDWQHVEQLSVSLDHLPLSAIDLWRRFGHSTAGMAAIAMRIGNLPAGFVERFSNELPFMWEVVSFGDWCNAMSGAVRQLTDWYGPKGAELLGKEHFDSRLRMLVEISPGLRALLEAARAQVTGDASQELRAIQHPAMSAVLRGQLFEGENCELQRLMRMNADVEWPGHFAGDVTRSRGDLILSEYLCPTSYSFRDSVINVPILVSIAAIQGSSSDWMEDVSRIRALREHRAFDPSWFDEAMHLTLSRCIASGLLKLKT